MPRRTRSGTLLALALGSLTSAAAADELRPSTEQVTERSQGALAIWDTLRGRVAGMRIQADQRLLSSGEFDGAQTWWTRSGLSIEGGIPVTDRFHLGLSPSLAWERLIVQGDGLSTAAPPSRHSDRSVDFLESSLRVGAAHDFSSTYGVDAVIGFSARHETGADYREAIQAGGSLAFRYRRGQWLRLRLGIGVGTDLDDGQVRLSPVYRIVVRPADRWALEASGLRGAIEWDATPRNTIRLEGGREGNQYRLAHRPKPPRGAGDGTLQHRQTRIELELRHRLTTALRLRGAIGLVLSEDLSVADEDGTELDARSERDPSATARFAVEFRF